MWEQPNQIFLTGQVITEPKWSEQHGWTFLLQVLRQSLVTDILPIRISSLTIPVREGMYIKIQGVIESVNCDDGQKVRLVTEVKALAWTIVEPTIYDNNRVILIGHLKEPATPRITPRKIVLADTLLKVREWNHWQTIPCLFWWQNAGKISRVSVDCEIVVRGRLQSRRYDKILDNGSRIVRTTYEVSVETFALRKDVEENLVNV